jgi:hypothetical protein
VLRARELFRAAGDNGEETEALDWRDVRFARLTEQLPKSGSALVGFLLAIKSATKVGVNFMVCQELDHLVWDFIQARAGNPDIDSSGWTDGEFSCLDAILDHKR